MTTSPADLEILRELEKKVLWLASWTIHHANALRENTDGLKVGGHQASSASLATIMTALYFRALRPQDRVAVKPHASPIFHAIQYLLGRQSRQKLDEGNIFEAILEGWKQGLRNCWWIIDYNRQSLDAVVREGLWARFEALFRAFGWDVVILKYGSLLEAAFREPGGENLRAWIDNCPNQLYSALVFQG